MNPIIVLVAFVLVVAAAIIIAIIQAERAADRERNQRRAEREAEARRASHAAYNARLRDLSEKREALDNAVRGHRYPCPGGHPPYLCRHPDPPESERSLSEQYRQSMDALHQRQAIDAVWVSVPPEAPSAREHHSSPTMDSASPAYSSEPTATSCDTSSSAPACDPTPSGGGGFDGGSGGSW